MVRAGDSEMNIKRIVDKLLSRMGLVRIKKHNSVIAGWEWYTKELAATAKTKGVCVLFDGEKLQHQKVEGPVFLQGKMIEVNACCILQPIVSHYIVFAPNALGCSASGNFFR